MSRADSTWRDKSWRKIPDSWRTGWKAKACPSFALYLEVFKNHLYYLWHVRVLPIKPCLHTQLLEHNRRYWRVSLWWGHLITWNGPMMGHLNSFSASGRGNLNNTFPKIQMPGGHTAVKRKNPTPLPVFAASNFVRVWRENLQDFCRKML